MARLSIIICDLCKSMSKETLPFMLSLQSGKGKNKEVTKAEICSTCLNELKSKIESEFNITNNFSQETKVEKKEIAAGETIVASQLNNVTAAPARPECTHDANEFEPPNNLTCKDCGEQWKV